MCVYRLNKASVSTLFSISVPVMTLCVSNYVSPRFSSTGCPKMPLITGCPGCDSCRTSQRGVPIAWIYPEYTSQRCTMGSERANRKKKRFNCRDCGHQDHSDRDAGVNIAVKGVSETGVDWNVSTLNTLPTVRTRELRRSASGRVNRPSVTPPFETIRSMVKL
jgi:hypothetical protein